MRYRLLLIVMLVSPLHLVAQDEQLWDPLTVDLTRSLTTDLFNSNAVPYVQPMVTTLNATSNARFYDHAYVPAEVDQPYFKVSVNGMWGVINDDLKTFQTGTELRSTGERRGRTSQVWTDRDRTRRTAVRDQRQL